MQILDDKATLLRIDSIRSTTEAGSGHPTSCASAADIVSVLFFSVMRYDPKKPRNPDNDLFVLSKGHAAPLLYAAWAEAGLFPREKLLRQSQQDRALIVAAGVTVAEALDAYDTFANPESQSG